MSKAKYLLVFLALFLGVVLFLPKLEAASTKSAPKFNPKKDIVYTPKIDTIKDVLTLAGSIDTDQIASVRFQNSGKLVWVGVKVGDHVRRGQALASLDKAELRKNLATQFNNYRKALSEFDDTNETYRKTKENLLVTDTIQRILNRTQYSLNNAVINYELTDMSIKEATIVSPMDGIVVAIDQPIAGTNVTPATATFTILNPDKLYFKAEIDQEAVTQVHLNQPATLRLDSYRDQTLDSQINYIAFTPVSGQTSTVYEIRFDLPVKNNNFNYRIGMDGDIDIILAQSNQALTVPTDAINDDNGQNYVFVKSGNNLVRRDVKLGIETDIATEVKEGLTPNDQVVVIKK